MTERSHSFFSLGSLVLVFALMGALAACGESAAPAGPRQGGPPRAVPVSVASVAQESLTEQLRAVGTLLADESVVLRPEIAGRVARIHAAEGEQVDAGALLISLDAAEQRARLAEVDATVELNRLDFARAQDLARSRMISAQDFDQARARLKASEAARERERVLLAKTELRAPFAGVLGLRHVSPGAYVQPGQDLVNLEALDPLKLEFHVPERYGRALAPGRALLVETDAAPGERFPGAVYAVNPALDPQTRTYAVRAHVPNTAGTLRPGMFARVEMTIAERPAAAVIPEQAIVPRGDRAFVFKVVDGKASLTPVRTGFRVPGRVEIVEGLAPGDVVVTAGQMKLRDGAPVAEASEHAQPAPGRPS
jgi:membrane fusion protein, multidrug efflux system